MRTDFVQPDGSTLSLDIRENLRFDPWQSQVFVHQPMDGRSPDARSRRTFHVAHRGNYDAFIAQRFGGVLQTVPFADGEFLVAGSEDPAKTQGLLLWRGPHHEVQTYIPSALALAGTTAVDYMAGLQFIDTPNGCVIEPASSVETVDVYESFLYALGVAGLTFHPPGVGLGFVPSWQGARVGAGEVWKTEDENQGDHLVLGADRVVCVVAPASGKKSLMGRCLQLVKNINSVSMTGKGKAS